MSIPKSYRIRQGCGNCKHRSKIRRYKPYEGDEWDISVCLIGQSSDLTDKIKRYGVMRYPIESEDSAEEKFLVAHTIEEVGICDKWESIWT